MWKRFQLTDQMNHHHYQPCGQKFCTNVIFPCVWTTKSIYSIRSGPWSYSRHGIIAAASSSATRHGTIDIFCFFLASSYNCPSCASCFIILLVNAQDFRKVYFQLCTTLAHISYLWTHKVISNRFTKFGASF